ncbi:MAG: hypothetical protein ACMXYC_04070 [Candidatus Woesearchaeota archaeon]
MNIHRKTNVFERLLLLVGISLGVIGFYMVNLVYEASGKVLTAEILMMVFIWLILIFIMILCAINENQREELNLLLIEHIKEVRALHEINHQLMQDHKKK